MRRGATPLCRRSSLSVERFSTEKKLETYINEHKTTDLIKKRLSTVVASKKLDIKRLSKKKGFEKLEQASDVQKYCALVNDHYVEPSKIFPELPESISLCDIKKLVDWYHSIAEKLTDKEKDKLQGLICESFDKTTESLCRKWETLTGQELDLAGKNGLPDLSKLPPLLELEQWKAPLPKAPYWSNRLHSMEARRLAHRPATDQDALNYDGPSGDEPPVNPESSSNDDSCTANNVESRESTEDNNTSVDAEHYLNELCCINKFRLYDYASFQPLRQPHAPDVPRHTFPGDLQMAEDIFYDYSVIIPVEECSAYSEEGGKVTFDPRAARVLAGKANNIVGFLSDIGLASSLGNYSHPDSGPVNVITDIDTLLNKVSSFKPQDYLEESDYATAIRNLQERLREMAGLLRFMAHTELYPLQGADILTLAEQVQHYRNLFDYETAKRRIPDISNQNKWVLSRLTSKDTNANPEYDVRIPDSAHLLRVPGHNINDNIIDALPGIPDWIRDLIRGFKRSGWVYLPESQYGVLHNYLHRIGLIVANQVDDYITTADQLAEKVKQLNTVYFEDFKRLASGIINSALISLSDLLQETAAQLTLPKLRRSEAYKRLGLQVIFRQYWHPAGYVMGKLVGYKNLIPNQKETLRRRTFVKTTQEMSRMEEFASARQDDYSHSQKESAEVTKEMANEFNFTTNASGHYNMGVYGVEANVRLQDKLTHTSKTVQNMLSESVMKGSAKYNEKREVKIRELAEVQDVQEITTELSNTNAEITANYFYYQLLREYLVTVHLHDLRPILLRTRNVPSPAEINSDFISKYMHILINRLAKQLSVDAQESADEIGIVEKSLIRNRAEMDQRAAELEAFKETHLPPGEDEPEKLNRWRELYRIRAEALSEARQKFIAVEEQYSRLRARMNRVINHIRENICYYMQFVWQDSPKVDQDKVLRKEKFHDVALPLITRGLMRQGYLGDEEVFDYTGQSIELFAAFLENLEPGTEILSGFIVEVTDEPIQAGTTDEQKLTYGYIKLNSVTLTNATVNGREVAEDVDYVIDYTNGTIRFFTLLDDTGPTISYKTYEKFTKTTLFQYLKRYNPPEELGLLIEQIENMAFVSDPLNPEDVLRVRRIQVAQDALVVETMPGQVPLLEGFQMAHRMLDVQKSCLENVHLAERMSDRPWKKEGEDRYEVKRFEGDGGIKKKE